MSVLRNDKPMNLNQITIPVTNLDRSIAFYSALGLKLIVHSNTHYARFLCPDGNTTFSLHLEDEVAQGNTAWIYFETADVAAKVRELNEQGIVFETTTTDQPWLWTEARLRDPDGHQLIVYHAGENRTNPPWRLPASF